jgi:hypothetical protein
MCVKHETENIHSTPNNNWRHPKLTPGNVMVNEDLEKLGEACTVIVARLLSLFTKTVVMKCQVTANTEHLPKIFTDDYD